jgi:hypothetical protein
MEVEDVEDVEEEEEEDELSRIGRILLRSSSHVVTSIESLLTVRIA